MTKFIGGILFVFLLSGVIFIAVINSRLFSTYPMSNTYDWADDSKVQQEFSEFMKKHPVSTTFEKINLIRNTVMKNTFFGTVEPEKFNKHFRNPITAALKLFAREKGSPFEQIPAECFSRTRFIIGLLKHLNIKTRRYVLFCDASPEGSLVSHTLYEVFVPEIDQWVLYDSNDNVLYKNNKGQILSMIEWV